MAASKYKPIAYFMAEAELPRKFPTEESAIERFPAIRYGGHIVCSHCGQPITYRYQDRLKAFHCYQCHNSFSPFADTIFRKTHLDLRVWFHAISLFINGRKGISSLRLARQAGVSVAAGWRYCTKDGVHTNGIENFWSILKRGIIGSYHHISLKYMQRYIKEFCFRQNTRKNPAAFDVLLRRYVLKQEAA